MTYPELNNLFCDGEDALLDRKDYSTAYDCFVKVFECAIAATDDTHMRELAVDSYGYLYELSMCPDEGVWEMASEMIHGYAERIEALKRV